MGGMEFNKIFAALLVAGIIAMFSGFVADQLTQPHKLKENAYKIEGVPDATGGSPRVQLAEPILSMIADADVARGQKVSKACASCHTFDKGGANGIGPNLYNIVGAKKQNISGFSYSGVLNVNGGDVWTYAELNKYLWKPKKYAPGTKMNFIGLKKPEDRAAMVAWLRTLSSSPKSLPGALDIAKEEAELVLPKDEAGRVEDAIDAVTDGKLKDGKTKDGLKKVKETVKDAKH